MIRHTLITSQIRFFREETDDPFKSYDAIATLTWETPGIVWFSGLHGKMNRSLLRDLMQYLDDHGVHTIKAYRGGSHSLPCSTLIGENLYAVDVKYALTQI